MIMMMVGFLCLTLGYSKTRQDEAVFLKDVKDQVNGIKRSEC